jgi:phosphoglycerate dehydrogenase-like enzyme
MVATTTVEIVLPRSFAESHGESIASVAPGRLRLVPVEGAAATLPDLSSDEVLLHGFWYGLPIVEEVLARMPRLRWLHSTGAGVDDLVAAGLSNRDVLVTNVAGAYAPAMAEYAVAAMVFLARDVIGLLDAQRKRHWLERVAPTGTTLHGKQVGIIGYGSIGRHLARACSALGMRVWATRRTPLFTSSEPLERWLPPSQLPELLTASDFVVVAASLNSTTLNLLGEAEFRAMKPGAFLVNVARGGLVDQDALLAALREGRLGGAVLDVTTPEPLPEDSPLWRQPNVLITPHLSGDTQEGWNRGIELFCANLGRYLNGSFATMANVVDFDVRR